MLLTVEGFNGRPVSAAAGLKPALVRNADGEGAVFQRGNSGTWHSWDEIEEYAENGLLTLCPKLGQWSESATVLYAHTEFVAPTQADSHLNFPLSLSVPSELLLVPRLSSYVACVPLNRANEILNDWGRLLLRSARSAIALQDGRLAYIEAMRARFCIRPGSHERIDAFALAFNAVTLEGRSTDALVADARFEGFDDKAILERARRLLPQAREWAGPPRRMVDTDDLFHRSVEEAA